MVTLGIVSDLHTEYWKEDAFATVGKLIQDRLKDADLILLPGDIGSGDGAVDAAHRLFPDKDVCFVAGNHEFYGKSHSETIAEIEAAAAHVPHVNFLNRSTYIGHGIRVLGATLWTDFALFGNAVLSMTQASIRTFHKNGFTTPFPDFYYILAEKGFVDPKDLADWYVSPENLLEWHKRDREWLLQELDTPFDGPTVVMTHHAPVSFALRKIFENDVTSPCFASRMENILLYKDPAAVVWGHTHYAVDVVHGNTKFVSNQIGYRRKVGEFTIPETNNLGTTIVL
jgi:predicted phosphodiesterase